MEKKEYLFTNKDLKRLIVPLVIEQILVMLVGMADTVMVSHVGEAAISGVALVDMLEYFIITVFAALATGGCVVISQYIGHSEPEKAGESTGQLIYISALFSLAVMIICIFGHKAILHLLFGKIEPDVMSAADNYFMITAFSFPFLGLYNTGCALFRSMQKTKITMYVSALMNVINIGGNAIGVFALRAGVAGVAVPTLISRAVACILLLILLYKQKSSIRPSRRSILTPNRICIARLLRIAVPNGLENGLFALGRVLVTGIVALCGTTQIAANGVANSIDQVAVMVVNAINLAIIPVVGECIGAGDTQQAKHYTKKLMKISYISTAAIGLAICLLLPLIMKFYKLSDEAYSYTCMLVVVHNLLAIVLHPTSFNLANSLRAAGDVKFTMIVGISSMIVFRLGSAILFAVILNLGVLGVWMAMGMDWFMRSLAFVLRYKNEKWKEYKAI